MREIDLIESAQMRTDIPDFAVGDTVNVRVKVIEGDKERVQDFEGIVIGRRGEGLKATFTVRKVASGVGVERIFPLHSPRIAHIALVRKGRVRRSKLYYIRRLTTKAVRHKTT